MSLVMTLIFVKSFIDHVVYTYLWMQMDFLLPLLGHEKPFSVRATALRCLHFISVNGMCYDPISASSITKALFSMVNEPELRSTMQCEALQILQQVIPDLLNSACNLSSLDCSLVIIMCNLQVLMCTSPDPSCIDIPEFGELLAIVSDAPESSNASKSFRAIKVLVTAITKFRSTETGSNGVCILPVPPEVVLLIVHQITFLLKLDPSQVNSAVYQDFQNLLNLLLILVGEHTDLGLLVLEKIHKLIEHIVSMCKKVVVSRLTDNSEVQAECSEEESKLVISKLICTINKIVVSCLKILHEGGALTSQVTEKLKLLVEYVQECSLFDRYTLTIYSFWLHYDLIHGSMINGDEGDGEADQNTQMLYQNHFVLRELRSIEFAQQLLIKRELWPAYKAGKYAVCHGAWATADYIFAELKMKVRSDIYSCWLKSLSQWVYSERIIQLLFLPKQGSISVNCLEIKEFLNKFCSDDLGTFGQDGTGNTDESDCCQAIVAAHHSISLAGKSLVTDFTSGVTFSFQRWFLALRKKVFGALAEILRTLSSVPYKQDDMHIGEGSIVENFKMYQVIHISSQLFRLSKEFDLMTSSFIGMDKKSSAIIKAIALSCSLLAVSAGFACYIPSLLATLKPCGLETSQQYSPTVLIQNLVGRLWNLDSDTCTSLCIIMETCGWSQDGYDWPFRNQILNTGCEVKEIVDLCNYAVTGIVGLQRETNQMHDKEFQLQITKNGLQLLENVILKWFRIPFRAPKYFFSVR